MQAPDFLSSHARHVEQSLTRMLEARAGVVEERLLAAMRYSLLAGGKRVRPALLLECYLACGGRIWIGCSRRPWPLSACTPTR